VAISKAPWRAESAVAGAVSAGAFLAAGSLAETATGSFAGFGTGEPGRIALHAIAGCASGASAGGSCGKQAAAGAFSELAGPIIAAGGDQFAYRVTAHSIAGGLGSILAGGKFENGAITGAFGYLFNHCAHGSCTSDFEQFMYDWWPGYKAGTLIHNQLLGDKSWTGWEVLDAAAVGSGIAGRGLQLLSSTSRLAGLGYDANKLNHIFGNADHLMGPLLQQTGSTERAMLAIDRAAQPMVSNPAALQAGTWINVQGNQVWVRGVDINDRVRIGTASMNAGR